MPRDTMNIRLSQHERDQITARAKADGETKVTSWARDALLAAARRQPLMSGQELETLAEAVEQLRAIGVNLNQLVRRSNMDTAERLWDADAVASLLAAIGDARNRILDITRRQDFSGS